MEKEPWEEDVYDNGEDKLKRTKKFSALNADRLLTILTIIFCILVVAVVCFLTYLSTGEVIDRPKWKVSTALQQQVPALKRLLQQSSQRQIPQNHLKEL